MALGPLLDEPFSAEAADSALTAACFAKASGRSGSSALGLLALAPSLAASRRTATRVCSSPVALLEALASLIGVSCTVSLDWRDWLLSGVWLSEWPEGLLETVLLPLLEESLYLSRRGWGAAASGVGVGLARRSAELLTKRQLVTIISHIGA